VKIDTIEEKGLDQKGRLNALEVALNNEMRERESILRMPTERKTLLAKKAFNPSSKSMLWLHRVIPSLSASICASNSSPMLRFKSSFVLPMARAGPAFLFVPFYNHQYR
jgi:hypothetical protein